jgi:N-carbamoyl-L-amino-acid hydrolase
MELSQYGAIPNGGVNRGALSDEEIKARALLVRWGRDIGLEPSSDEIANLFLRLPGQEPSLPPVLVGSHIDSVPTGGKFDGAFGVIAALESVEAILAAGLRPRRSIEVVSWTNEEGTRFSPAVMGSSVFAGKRRLTDIEGVRDAAGITVADALADVLKAEPDVARRKGEFPVGAYLEAHIEQGQVLESAKKTIGLVTGITGKRNFRITVKGVANHAATTPKSLRRDAFVEAVEIASALNRVVWLNDEQTRFTIGMFDVVPNQPYVIPGEVVFLVDIRHPNEEKLRAAGDLVRQVCREMPKRCEVTVEEPITEPPLEFDPSVRKHIGAAANRLGLPSLEMSSGAWHDSVFLQKICPTAMIFIPCKDGISHNEAESATKDDVHAGTCVLAEATFAVASAM